MSRKSEARILLFGLITRPTNQEEASPWVDLHPKMVSRTPLPYAGGYTSVFPEGLLLFTPKLPHRLEDQYQAAVRIPRGYGGPFVLEHQTIDTGEFSMVRVVPEFKRLPDAEGFMHTLHRINPDQTATLLGAGFRPNFGKTQLGVPLFHEIPVARSIRGDRELIISVCI